MSASARIAAAIFVAGVSCGAPEGLRVALPPDVDGAATLLLAVEGESGLRRLDALDPSSPLWSDPDYDGRPLALTVLWFPDTLDVHPGPLRISDGSSSTAQKLPLASARAFGTILESSGAPAFAKVEVGDLSLDLRSLRYEPDRISPCHSSRAAGHSSEIDAGINIHCVALTSAKLALLGGAQLGTGRGVLARASFDSGGVHLEVEEFPARFGSVRALVRLTDDLLIGYARQKGEDPPGPTSRGILFELDEVQLVRDFEAPVAGDLQLALMSDRAVLAYNHHGAFELTSGSSVARARPELGRSIYSLSFADPSRIAVVTATAARTGSNLRFTGGAIRVYDGQTLRVEYEHEGDIFSRASEPNASVLADSTSMLATADSWVLLRDEESRTWTPDDLGDPSIPKRYVLPLADHKYLLLGSVSLARIYDGARGAWCRIPDIGSDRGVTRAAVDPSGTFVVSLDHADLSDPLPSLTWLELR
ncbi:MAG: hypothetical protein HYV07_06555 [Deltaproteobacteria bacterium]|nr:hypothetical protein [Deltaproteobacteria bacterium]